MATTSRIGIENQDGTINSIYCHWDGHPESNGVTLMNNYNNHQDVQDLISLGDISYLAPKLFPNGAHSFDKPEPGITVAYHRDRGEDYKIARHANMETYFKRGNQNYLYLFTKEGEWFVSGYSSEGPLPLSDVLKEINYNGKTKKL